MDPTINVDEIWRKLGKFGRFQVVQLLITFVTIWSAAFSLMSSVFTGFKPSVKCAPIENTSNYNESDVTTTLRVEYRECSVVFTKNFTNGTTKRVEAPCPAGYSYNIPRERSLVAEFDLVCGDDGLAEVAQMLTMAGMGLGAVLASVVSDRYGRKVVQVGSHVAIFLTGIGVAFVPNYTVLIVLRFISGALQQALAVVGAVLAMEWVPEEGRFVGEVCGLLFWTTGVVLLTPIAYLMQYHTWRELQIALTLCSSYSLVQYWIQEESVRWLLINGKTDQAERILRKAAKWNNVNYDDVISSNIGNGSSCEIKMLKDTTKKYTQEEEELLGSDDDKAKSSVRGFVVEHYTILTIFKNRYILQNSMIMWFTWLTDSLVYFGLTLAATTLAGNRFLNYFLSGAVEYVACFLEYHMMKRVGRRSITVIFHVTSASALLIATVVHLFGESESMVTASLVFTLIGKMAITGSFSTIFLFTPELYPTNLRNVGMGMSSAFARLGGMLSPFAGTLAKKVSWLPGSIFAFMCFLVALAVLRLPETRGVELPSTIRELELWHRKQKTKKGADDSMVMTSSSKQEQIKNCLLKNPG